MKKNNFLIGRGELLTYDIESPKRGFGEKKEVYTLEKAIERLTPKFNKTAQVLKSLPQEACPQNYGVAKLLINPSYIARSYFPKHFLNYFNLESIGSRTIRVTPERWTKKTPPEETSSTEIFVAGKIGHIEEISNWIEDANFKNDKAASTDLRRIENFSAHDSDDRIVGLNSLNDEFFEVGLHLLPSRNAEWLQNEFLDYAYKNNFKVFKDYDFRAGNLWFIPIQGDVNKLESLAQFTFMRVVRPVPKLKSVQPLHRGGGPSIQCYLPEGPALSNKPRVAILDGGLPEEHSITPWLKSYKVLDPEAEDDPNGGPEHGLSVTSALLFGPIKPNGVANRPYTTVDHLRVLDKRSNEENPLELYRTLSFVEEVLMSRAYEFINLSLGPDLPIEDYEIHAWTSVIDDLLSDGNTFMTVAVGNNGERDHATGNARIQVPADCVNAISVGAANSMDNNWDRSSYSAIGPGRRPGVIKPDILAFGGDAETDYFHTLRPGKNPSLKPEIGTSFAAPYLLRSAAGIRAILGDELTPLAIKALLIHCAKKNEKPTTEIGWGKVPEEIMDIISCADGKARIVYQGELKPGKFLRAHLPLPKDGIKGMIQLTATFCYASPTDPQDAAAYTKAGLKVSFRPKSKKIKSESANAKTRTFFKMKNYAHENERRSDDGKWETVLHATENMRGSSLDTPIFDIHYQARDKGGNPANAQKIRYALILSLEAKNHPDLHSKILENYINTLTTIEPTISIPIHT